MCHLFGQLRWRSRGSDLWSRLLQRMSHQMVAKSPQLSLLQTGNPLHRDSPRTAQLWRHSWRVEGGKRRVLRAALWVVLGGNRGARGNEHLHSLPRGVLAQEMSAFQKYPLVLSGMCGKRDWWRTKVGYVMIDSCDWLNNQLLLVKIVKFKLAI